MYNLQTAFKFTVEIEKIDDYDMLVSKNIKLKIKGPYSC